MDSAQMKAKGINTCSLFVSMLIFLDSLTHSNPESKGIDINPNRNLYFSLLKPAPDFKLPTSVINYPEA